MRLRKHLGFVLAGVLLITGCGKDEPEDPRAASERAWRTVLEAVRAEGTVKSSFTVIRQSAGTLTGEAETVVGGGTAFSYEFKNQMDDTKVDAEAVAVDDTAYLRSRRWKPERGRDWFPMPRTVRGEQGMPLPADWLAVVMSRLHDPAFLLEEGLTGVKMDRVGTPTVGPPSTDARPPVVEGATTLYEAGWYLNIDRPGPRVAEWAEAIGDAAHLSIDVWTGPDNLPLRMEVDSSMLLMYFKAEIEFHDYGAPVTVTAPPVGEVARPAKS